MAEGRVPEGCDTAACEAAAAQLTQSTVPANTAAQSMSEGRPSIDPAGIPSDPATSARLFQKPASPEVLLETLNTRSAAATRDADAARVTNGDPAGAALLERLAQGRTTPEDRALLARSTDLATFFRLLTAGYSPDNALLGSRPSQPVQAGTRP
jgi:hypothetical protein